MGSAFKPNLRAYAGKNHLDQRGRCVVLAVYLVAMTAKISLVQLLV